MEGRIGSHEKIRQKASRGANLRQTGDTGQSARMARPENKGGNNHEI